ncbi:hypothetical protein GCM10009745_38520 [Kribbella yunnanensis]|uniref:DUF4328 domain-containing protein n=1 Tax=Kribbella yunnanensis TaxID=190194 RepID=A0ABN2HKT5_9ACTN
MQQQVEPARVRAPRLRDVRGVGIAASWAVCAVAVGDVVSAVGDWRTVRALDGARSEAELAAVDRFNLIVGGVDLGLLAVAGVLFVVWLLRARENSEFLCDAKHYYARSWAVFGWIVPVVGFWALCKYVQNVAVASDPSTEARNAWIDHYKNKTVTRWWVLWILQHFAALLTFRAAAAAQDPYSSGGYGSVALFSSISALLSCAGAVCAVLVIRSINRMQRFRRPIPWWHVAA